MNNIDILEELIRDYKDEKEFVGEEIIKAIETLIAENKELKEKIEELKEEQAKRQWVHIKENGEVEPLFYISKDKIKAKIEEINKEMLNEENSLELFYRKKYCKEVLQSLLEKNSLNKEIVDNHIPHID